MSICGSGRLRWLQSDRTVPSCAFAPAGGRIDIMGDEVKPMLEDCGDAFSLNWLIPHWVRVIHIRHICFRRHGSDVALVGGLPSSWWSGRRHPPSVGPRILFPTRPTKKLIYSPPLDHFYSPGIKIGRWRASHEKARHHKAFLRDSRRNAPKAPQPLQKLKLMVSKVS